MMNNTLMWASAEPYGWMGYGEGWTTARHTLDGLGGEPNVRLRIAFGSQQSGTPLDGFAFDDVRIFEQPAYDLGIDQITYPQSSCELFSESPVVDVTNYGADTTNYVWFGFQVNSGPVESMLLSGEYLPGQTYNNTLYNIFLDLDADSTYLLKVWVVDSLNLDPYPENDTAWRVVVNQTNDTLPYFENFEYGNGGWTIAQYPDDQNQSWEWGIPAGTVISDPGNHAWVTNLDGENNFQERGYIESPCLDFGAVSQAILEFKIWRDLLTDYSGQVYVQTWDSENNWETLGWKNDYLNWYNEGYEGHLSWYGDDRGWAAVTDTGWVTVRHEITHAVDKIRIYFGSTENWWHGEGVAIDDIRIIERPDYDLRMLQWVSPKSGPALSDSENVRVFIINDGQLAPEPSFTVSYSIDGGTSWYSDTPSGFGFLQDNIFELTFSGAADFSAYGQYQCIAKVSYPGDIIFNDNDSIVVTITNTPVVSTFPYIQEFELGAGYWTSGGQNSSWALGTPVAPTINHASSGTNAWVTNLNGICNNNEQSWVESPYFDLSALSYPYIKLDKWSSIDPNQGTAFQYSIDSGYTWVHVGNIGEGVNWYNNHLDGLNFLPDNAGWSEFDSDWLTAGHDLSSIPQVGPVKFRFIFGSSQNTDTEGFGFDNIRIYDRAKDGAVTELITPYSSAGLTSAETVRVKVQNRGMMSWMDSLKVCYQINMGPVISQKEYSLYLSPGDSIDVVFDTLADLSAPGTYNFKIWTEIVNEGWPYDDTLYAVVKNKPIISAFPYFEDFEGAQTWEAIGTNPSWQMGTPAGAVIDHAASGSNAWVTNLTGSYNQDEQSFVDGPYFDFSGLTHPVIKLKIWTHTNLQAGAAIKYSLDGGESWNNLGNQGQRINWYDDHIAAMAPMDAGDCWTGLRYDWMTASYDLGFLGGEPNVRIIIIFASDPGANNVYDGFAFDDIMIYDRPDKDAFLVHINNPSTGCSVSPHIDFEMQNMGTGPLDSLTVGYQVNGETPGSFTFNDTIYPDQVYQNGFDIPDYFTNPGEYIIKVWTSVTGDMTTYNDTLYRKAVKQPLINANPYFEDFESDTNYWAAVSAGYVGYEKLYPGGFDHPAGWKLGTPDGAVINNAASGSKAWYTSTGGAPFYDISYMVSPCFDLSSYTKPGIQFKMWRQMATPAMKVNLEYSTDQGATWNLLGNTGDTLNWYTTSNQWMDTLDSGWITARHMLDNLGGQPNVRLKFYTEMIGNYDMLDGFAFDDFMIYEVTASQDAAIVNILAPENKCEFLPGDTVKVEIHNAGTASISNIGVHYMLSGYDPVNEIFTGTLSPDETTVYAFSTTTDLSAYQAYDLTAWVTLAGDPFQDNDTLHTVYFSTPVISTFPYNQDFEGGDGYWHSYGDQSSWALGAPAGSVINSAASGTNAWVTNLTGPYNNDEYSHVESPCFDFSSLINPVFEMDIWTDCGDLDDGAVLQYSTDNGNTWQTVGSAEDPDWYNYTSPFPDHYGMPITGNLEYWSSRSWGWWHVIHGLDELAGQPGVRFRITFANDHNDNYEGIAFDDISIYDQPVSIPWDVSGINVDGIADEILWLNAPQIPLPGQGIGGPSDFSASWRAAWDANNLYLLVEVTDDTLYNADGPGSASNDNIEVYLNLYNNKDGMGYTAADNWGFRFIWNLPAVEIEQLPGIEFTNSTSDSGYIFEIRLPWQSLLQNGNIDIPLASGTMIGFDVRITDNDGSGTFPRFNWKGAVRSNFNNAGNIMLSGRPAVMTDAKMVAIDYPDASIRYCQPGPQNVTVRILNNGQQTISNFDAGFMVDGVEQAVETITDSIPPGDTLTYTFLTQADLSLTGYYKSMPLAAYTLLPGDETPPNNYRQVNLDVYGNYIPAPGWTIFGPCDYNNISKEVTGVAEDASGNIWIGTGNGVIKYDGVTFTTYDTLNSDIGGINVESIYADNLGNVLVGDWFNGLSIFNGSTWTSYDTSNSDISGNCVEGLLYYNGLYYIGTDGGGLDVFDGSSFIAHYNTGNSGIISDRIQDLAVDSSGNIWIAGTFGVSVFDGISFTNYTRDTLGVPTATIYRIMVDDNNNIWIATYNGGIIKITGSTWTNYTTANSGLSNNRIFSLGKDKYGRIWIGTFGTGYDVFDGTSWVNYNADNVLSNNNSWQDVLTASDGRLWLPTYNGLDRYNTEYFDPIPIPYDVTGITVDGIADESLWAGAPVVTMDATGPDGPADFSARWRAAWDADNLYVLVEVTDDTLFNGIDPALATGYQNDNVEIYLDMYNVKDGTNYTTPDNWRLRYIWDLPLEHGEKVAGVEFTNTSSDSGYVFEFKFPWLSLLQSGNIDVPLVTGTQIGFDVKITDNDGSGVFYRYTWKNAVAGNFDGAGAIQLEGRPPITTDAKVIAIIQPVDTMYYCQPLPQDVTISIVNAGEQPFSDFDVAFMVDTIEQAVETIADTLWPGDSLTYTFTTQADLSYPGFFRNTILKTYVVLPGDEMMQNDIKVINQRVYGDNLETPGWTLTGPCKYNNDPLITGIAEDNTGNIWIGTSAGGVMMFDGMTFTTYDTSNSNIGGINVEVIYTDGIGNVLVGDWYNGLSIFNGATWTSYKTSNSAISGDVVEALLYHDGLYYIGTDGGGLDVFDGASFIASYNTGNSAIIGDAVFDLDADSAGNIWIAALNGISVFNGTDFTNYSTAVIGAGPNSIYRVFIDDSSRVWVGTNGFGLFMLDQGTWTNYTSANSSLSNNSIFSIGQDNNGNMWFYTFGGGLDKFDGATWTNYNMDNVLPNNYSWQDPLMASDGRIWFPTYNGIAIYDPSILQQTINLAEGWNIFSTYLLPLNPDMQAIMQPLIDADLLVKVQDEAGASVDSVPGIGWVNSIGNLEFTEGYKIKVKASTQLVINGTLVPLPATVGLTSGWNIISYPEVAPENTATVLDSLVTLGQLDKVQDETGSAFENVPPIGWIDNIGQFLTGEGYKMKVNTNTSIIIHESTLKAGIIIRPMTLVPEYFRPAYTGYGLDHMNLYIVSAVIDGVALEPGDEIAVYDGETCVGAVRIGYQNDGYISMKASADDPTTKTKDGFSTGNKITFRVWDASEQQMTNKMEVTYYEGYTDRFQGSATTLLDINATGVTTDNEDIPGLVTALGNNYPNPFNNETTIEYSLAADRKVTISIYDLLGRKLRILVDEVMPAGHHKVLWDGRDDLDQAVTSGMYFYEMRAGDFRSVKRMNLIY